MSAAFRSDARSGTWRVLVTGAEGFTGRYLVELLERHGHEVHGVVQEPHESEGRYVADLLDRSALGVVVRSVRPTHVVHLAAISFVAHDDVDEIYRTNVVGTRNLLQALAESQSSEAPLQAILLASSANVYGNARSDPIVESEPLRPANDYAVSKLAMEYMASLWTDRLPLTIVRPFNYTGVGQSTQFLVPKIVDAFKSRSAGIELGNLDVERDFSDVRDVVECYRMLLAKSPGGVFNVCSGQVHSLKEILLLAEGITGHGLAVEVNPQFVREREVKRLRGSSARLRVALNGWEARPFRETLEWMLAP